MKLPVIYKRASTGAIQQWEIEVRGADILTRHGKVGGKIQETSDTVKVAKSADTVEGQAKAEATSKHLRQRKKGYVDSIAAAEAGTIGKEIEGGILPMLASKYEDVADKLVFPCYVQPKLDGHRCVGEPQTGALWTRTRKKILSVPHIAEAIGIFDAPWVDGELYVHSYRNDFEKITSLLRKQEPAEGHEVIEYHVYDLPGEGTFAERSALLEEMRPHFVGTPVKIVATVLVENEEEMWRVFASFLKDGYEGAIARNSDGLYVNKRSAHLMKLKEFSDAEFKIAGLAEGRGKLQGHCGSFVCTTDDGKVFNAKMAGPTGKLKEAWENPDAWIGKDLTVRYFGLTAGGIPRFPVGMRLREDL